jgi:hypothetical protein
MRFSTATGIQRGKNDDWFDPVLEQDSPLYIDPYLVFKDSAPMWTGAYDELVAFFERASELVLASGGTRNTAAWRKAIRLLQFPEPHELALGVAMGSPLGSGTGTVFADRIADVLNLLGSSAAPNLASIGGFALFCEGLGVDRISDIIANVLKSRLIAYTQQIMRTHSITGTSVTVKHSSWDRTTANWQSDELELWQNPATGGGVLLVPDRFLKEMPVVEPGAFWDWA